MSGQPPFCRAPARRLVDLVEVRPLLAVDLDVDEQLVHQRRGLGVREALLVHHVAPVAGGVADGEQNRLVRLARLCQRFVAPGAPMHRIVLVQEQIGAGFGRRADCGSW